MGLSLKHLHLVACVMLLFPFLSYSQYSFVKSRATYYGSPDCSGTPTGAGACGYSDYGKTMNDGSVAGVSRLYRNGTGCGACYKVRCLSPQHCSDDGVNVVVTDYGEGDNTDFNLSPHAYAKLAHPNTVLELFSYGVVDVEYKRIPCSYSGCNKYVKFKVHEHSKFSDYLAIAILYQSGINDIMAIDIWQEDYKEWRCMRRAFGAVFDIPNPPKGAITLRFQVSGSGGTYWVQATNVIPNDWKVGVAYDSTIQLN